MKITILVVSMLMAQGAAYAKTVRGAADTPSTMTAFKCDQQTIPDAVRASVRYTLSEAAKVCAEPIVKAVRVLSLNPYGCSSWNPGYAPQIELDFECGQ